MSEVIIPDPRATEAARRSPPAATWKEHPLARLTQVRFLEFIREPEALFWVFIFPILLAAGLGIAFRNRPADVLQIAAVTPQLAQSLRQEKLLDVAELPAAAAERALRNGKVALLAVPGPNGSVVFRYDDTNPEGRAARMLADRAVQRAAGRIDPVAYADQFMREPGSRYIDFLIPGLLGMNLMGSAIWGMGFAIVDARRKKLMKRLVAHPCRGTTICCRFCFRGSCCWWWKWASYLVLVRWYSAFPCAVRRWIWCCCACWVRYRSAPSAC